MKRISKDEVISGGAAPSDPSRFTGPVRQRAVHDVTEPTTVRALLVTFEDGARTHWHRHAGGQVLHVVAGAGRAATRGGEEVDLHPGDVLFASPGEEHWHGAAEGATMTHLAVSIGDTVWSRPES